MKRYYLAQYFNGTELVYKQNYDSGDMAVVIASKKIIFQKDDGEHPYVISEVTYVEDGMMELLQGTFKNVNISVKPIFSET